jgi:hypothetical protein
MTSWEVCGICAGYLAPPPREQARSRKEHCNDEHRVGFSAESLVLADFGRDAHCCVEQQQA